MREILDSPIEPEPESRLSVRGIARRMRDGISCRLPVADTDYQYAFPFTHWTGEPVDSMGDVLDAMEDFESGKKLTS